MNELQQIKKLIMDEMIQLNQDDKIEFSNQIKILLNTLNFKKYSDYDLAWLAGFWDGEGSIGLVSNKTTKILVAQLSHTEFETVQRILDILKNMNISGRGYTYQERDPAKHRDAHYVRITGIANILKFAKLLLPFVVTKKIHFEVAIEWAESRIKVAGGTDEKGHLFRGGEAKNRTYSQRDMELFEEISILNKRGPQDRARRSHGRIKCQL